MTKDANDGAGDTTPLLVNSRHGHVASDAEVSSWRAVLARWWVLMVGAAIGALQGMMT